MGIGGVLKMNENSTIFLSASVPDTTRFPQYAESADNVAIAAAVGALVHVLLGRRRLVWGGHPAITPMVYAIAEDMGVDYSKWVTLYQSNYFEDRFPEDNSKFGNVVFTPKGKNRSFSVAAMREKMLKDFSFEAGVFIGGMDGVVEEFHLLKKFQPSARVIPVISTGGATLEIATEIGGLSAELASNLDYISLFHSHLGVSAAESRYSTPEDQPRDLADRLLSAGHRRQGPRP